jgi:hypothetical protein
MLQKRDDPFCLALVWNILEIHAVPKGFGTQAPSKCSMLQDQSSKHRNVSCEQHAVEADPKISSMILV